MTGPLIFAIGVLIAMFIQIAVLLQPEPQPHVWCVQWHQSYAKMGECMVYSTLTPSEYAAYVSPNVIDRRPTTKGGQ